jgi:hypothetical protein
MRISACLLAVVGFAGMLCAQPSTVNFNLVQVNHYNGQQAVVDSAKTQVQRITIDVNNPEAYRRMVSEASAGRINIAPVAISVESSGGGSMDALTLPWESQTVLRSTSGADSFKVTSSRAGCPGTEIRPSVSVAFSTPHGWSDPPIRFGPLNDHTVCPLGKGYQLEVSVKGDNSPSVRLREQAVQYGHR